MSKLFTRVVKPSTVVKFNTVASQRLATRMQQVIEQNASRMLVNGYQPPFTKKRVINYV